VTDEIVKPFSEGTQETPVWKRWINPVGFGALAVFVITQVVYITTLTITCPFWDSGEFIATSYTLGIPHPPGTPLYVLIGRLFTLIPVAFVATRVNYLSALASSMAAVFTFLVAIRFFQRWPRSYGPRSSPPLAEPSGTTPSRRRSTASRASS
jgi:hypothetical protein